MKPQEKVVTIPEDITPLLQHGNKIDVIIVPKGGNVGFKVPWNGTIFDLKGQKVRITIDCKDAVD